MFTKAYLISDLLAKGQVRSTSSGEASLLLTGRGINHMHAVPKAQNR